MTDFRLPDKDEGGRDNVANRTDTSRRCPLLCRVANHTDRRDCTPPSIAHRKTDAYVTPLPSPLSPPTLHSPSQVPQSHLPQHALFPPPPVVVIRAERHRPIVELVEVPQEHVPVREHARVEQSVRRAPLLHQHVHPRLVDVPERRYSDQVVRQPQVRLRPPPVYEAGVYIEGVRPRVGVVLCHHVPSRAQNAEVVPRRCP